MTRVLLLGSGAREHAIAVSLIRSEVELHAHMEHKNPGIAQLSSRVTLGSVTDSSKLPELDGYDYVIIGPEAPLQSGVSDFVISQGIACVAPCKKAAMIETSKSFARLVISETTPQANPRYSIARNLDEIREAEERIGIQNIVVKPDGLTGGKGVRVFGEHLTSKDDLEQYAINLMQKMGLVILEEKLEGVEFTLQAFSDGRRLASMPIVRDYKRAYDGDVGPNTGSMGSYSTSTHGMPFLTPRDLDSAKSIMRSTLDGIRKKTGNEFRGILYGQFMKTQEGIKVVEYNARFGDPEAMNVLSVMSDSLDSVCQGIIDKNLGSVKFHNKATVCVYVVPEGYPGLQVVKDSPITVISGGASEIYYASVNESNGRILTTGSRAMAVLAKGNTVPEARRQVYQDVKRIEGRLRFRTDIALDA